MDLSQINDPDLDINSSPFLGAWTRALPLAIAILGTGGVFLGLSMFGDPNARLYTLLLERGWLQFVTGGLFFWGLGHIVRRWVVQAGERHALAACQKLVRSTELNSERVPILIGALFPLRHSLAAPVLTAIMSYFRGARPTRDEVFKVANQEIDRAHDRIDADYRALHATLWLLPLSGFLGTVVGMAQAIGSFDAVIGSLGTDLSALTPTVAGLATAFDTTLLALVLVVPLKILEVGIEGRDQRMIEAVDRVVGSGLVRELDLGGLAQQSPEEAALDRFVTGVQRAERHLQDIDKVLASITKQIARMPDAGATIAAFFQAAQVTQQTLPVILRELNEMRAQGERPLILSRGAEPSHDTLHDKMHDKMHDKTGR